MKIIRVYSDIGESDEWALFMEAEGYGTAPLGLEKLRNIVEETPEGEDLKFLIHSDGGDVVEGLAIYDYLRASGRTIHTQVDGKCHSIAVLLLLSAPLANRSASKHSTALIHQVYANMWGAYRSSELDYVKQQVEDSMDSIAEVYADRTNLTVDEALERMDAEKFLNTTELMELGFISKLVPYNTNRRNIYNRMSKNKKSLAKRTDSFFASLQNVMGGRRKPSLTNYDYPDSEGKVLFTTDSTEDTLAEGDTVTVAEGVDATGTYELGDGRIVTLTEGVVDSIVEDGEAAEHIEELEEHIADLENKLAESTNLLREFSSSHIPETRRSNPRSPKSSNRADLKKEAAEKLKNLKK